MMTTMMERHHNNPDSGKLWQQLMHEDLTRKFEASTELICSCSTRRSAKCRGLAISTVKSPAHIEKIGQIQCSQLCLAWQWKW